MLRLFNHFSISGGSLLERARASVQNPGALNL